MCPVICQFQRGLFFCMSWSFRGDRIQWNFLT
jgi:hypothetical protein